MSVEVDLIQIPPSLSVGLLGKVGTVDFISGQSASAVSASGRFTIDLEGIAGRTIVVQLMPQAHAVRQENPSRRRRR